MRLSLWERSRELITRAERKAGELLQQLERNQGGAGKFGTVHSSVEQTVSEYREVLTDSDIAPTTAHRWQTVAQVPDVDPTKGHLCRAIRLL